MLLKLSASHFCHYFSIQRFFGLLSALSGESNAINLSRFRGTRVKVFKFLINTVNIPRIFPTILKVVCFVFVEWLNFRISHEFLSTIKKDTFSKKLIINSHSKQFCIQSYSSLLRVRSYMANFSEIEKKEGKLLKNPRIRGS